MLNKITLLLTPCFLFCLFYGQIPTLPLMALCCISILFLWHFGADTHVHAGVADLDRLARRSPLKHISPSLKMGIIFALLLLGVASPTPAVGIVLALLCGLILTTIGGVSRHDYVRLMLLPLTFLLIGSMALLWEVFPEAAGQLSFPIGHHYLCLTRAAQLRTQLVTARAFGALSCLYLFSLTTPMPHIIRALKGMHVPQIMIQLMYLIYRYLFIIFHLHHHMRQAADCRLGFNGYTRSLQTTAALYSNLIMKSYQIAARSFDAMESRCYQGDIDFWESRETLKKGVGQ